MEALQPTSIVSLFEMTKSERGSFVTVLVDAIEEGDVDPLKLHLHIKSMEKIIAMLTTEKDGGERAVRYRNALVKAAQAYGAKKFEFHGAEIEVKETGVKYDYSKTEDVELLEMMSQAEELDAKIKKRQKMLQSVDQKGMLVTNSETGDTYMVYPPAKTSTTNVQVTFKA